MTNAVKGMRGGKVLSVLEGGYNLESLENQVFSITLP
jgi:acetoin utilization deacetylase AcuC-like enzyme